MTRIVWHEWPNNAAMADGNQHEIEIDTTYMDGGDIACVIAKCSNVDEPECFRDGGEVVITEPENLAGTYDIFVDYEPTFYASRRQT